MEEKGSVDTLRVQRLHQLLQSKEIASALDIMRYVGIRNHIGEKGNTTLHYAILSGSSEIVAQLLSHGAKPNSTNEQNETPLHLAAYLGDTYLTQLLIQSRADLNGQTKELMTPLHYAAQEQHVNVVDALIRCGAVLNLRDQYGQTPLHIAVQTQNSEICKLLIQFNAATYCRDRQGNTPLHSAALVSSHRTAVLLLQTNCNVDAQNDAKETALHIACSRGSDIFVRVLMKAGANPFIQDLQGRMPYDVAVEKNYWACVDALPVYKPNAISFLDEPYDVLSTRIRLMKGISEEGSIESHGSRRGIPSFDQSASYLSSKSGKSSHSLSFQERPKYDTSRDIHLQKEASTINEILSLEHVTNGLIDPTSGDRPKDGHFPNIDIAELLISEREPSHVVGQGNIVNELTNERNGSSNVPEDIQTHTSPERPKLHISVDTQTTFYDSGPASLPYGRIHSSFNRFEGENEGPSEDSGTDSETEEVAGAGDAFSDVSPASSFPSSPNLWSSAGSSGKWEVGSSSDFGSTTSSPRTSPYSYMRQTNFSTEY